MKKYIATFPIQAGDKTYQVGEEIKDMCNEGLHWGIQLGRIQVVEVPDESINNEVVEEVNAEVFEPSVDAETVFEEVEEFTEEKPAKKKKRGRPKK